MDTPEGLRLRLMTLLSLYDLLPYSISHPPNGTAPMTLDEAIGPEAVRRCLEAISRQSQSLPTELANILRSYTRNAASGNARPTYYSSQPASQSYYHGSSHKSSR